MPAFLSALVALAPQVSGPSSGVFHPPPDFVVRHFPQLAESEYLELAPWQWIALSILLVCSILLGFALSKLIVPFTRKLSAGSARSGWALPLALAVERPVLFLFSLAIFNVVMRWLDLVGPVGATVGDVSKPLFISGVAWLVIAATGALVRSLELHLNGPDEFQNRGVRTQLQVVHRVGSALVVVVAAGLVLSTFQVVRNLEVSLLASAGIASVVIGFAAQKSLGTLLGGLQLSLSQPIRLGDTVVFQTQFGTVEEIRLTYVVLALWDKRRMVVPVNLFLDGPFENWTKVETNLMGTVELWADYRTPLAPLRAALARICAESQLWDKQVAGLQITEATERTMQIRLLVSAANASDLFDLRCEVREKMIATLQELDGGSHFPTLRVQTLGDASDSPRPLHARALAPTDGAAANGGAPAGR